MSTPVKPTRVLCKRTLAIGDTYYWDDKNPPQRHEIDNRMVVEGNWYDVLENQGVWDEDKRSFSFKIIDNQGNRHSFSMYEEEDKKNWPDICTLYGPSDYSKWFYTPEELTALEQGTFKLVEDIRIKPGQTHWVKNHLDEWIVAYCKSNTDKIGKFTWNIIATDAQFCSDDFKEIGHEVVGPEDAKKLKERIEDFEELNKELFILVDAINKPDSDEVYPQVEDIMPHINKAIDNWFKKRWKALGNIFF